MVYEIVGHPKRVLVVDDAVSGELIRNYLTSEYEVTVVQTPQEAQRYIDRNGFPHIMLAEATIARIDILAFCEELQQGIKLLPIIIMSGDDRLETVVRSLKVADDFMLKPIEEKVLLLRIQNIFHRICDFSYAKNPPIQITEQMMIDPVSREMIVGHRRETLSPTEFGLLMTLLKHRGKAVDAGILISNVWLFSDDVYEDTLRVHIHRLRRKIEGISPGDSKIIVTERGIGYSLRI